MHLKYLWFYFFTLTNITRTLCCYLPISDYPLGACADLYKYVVGREEWKACEPTGILQCFPNPVEYVIIHHTVTDPCSNIVSCQKSMQKLQNDHQKTKNWFDVGYHFVIGGDGRAYEGRPLYKVGAHTKFHNKKAIGIAFFGDYDKDCPSPDMLNLVPKIVYCGVEKGILIDNFTVIGHRDAYCTSCPGDALYNIIKQWPRFPTTVPIPSFTCDVQNETTPEPEVITTTEEVVTTEIPTTTTEVVTTTTEKTTTTVATTTTTTKKPIPVIIQPFYYYYLWPKKQSTCCYNDKTSKKQGGIFIPAEILSAVKVLPVP